MKNNQEILSLFHHIHHTEKGHEVHHCGGKHAEFDPEVDYQIEHCACGKHRINKEEATGHATDSDLKSVKVKIKFSEKCPDGGWYLESGMKVC